MLGAYVLDAFGKRTGTDNTADPYAGFGGQWGYYADAETGLSLLSHRYYDSSAGRFLTRDPLGYGGGTDLYAFCGNNPVMGADPLGLMDERQYLGAQAGLGAAGFAPILGILANLASAGLSFKHGDYTGAGLSLLACAPGAGDAFDGIKEARTVEQLAELGKDAENGGELAHDAVLVEGGGSELRQVRFTNLSNKAWGLTQKHLEKHFFGSGSTSLRQIDPTGNPDLWVKNVAELLQSPITKTTPNGMLDIIKTFQKADGSGTYNLGVRLAPISGNNYELITVLTKQ